MGAMAKKRKKKQFRAVQAVKALARERIGAPPGRRVLPDRKKTIEARKRKPNLQELLGEI